jgi:hypothetical protein
VCRHLHVMQLFCYRRELEMGRAQAPQLKAVRQNFLFAFLNRIMEPE